MTPHICDSEFPWSPPDARAGDFYKLRLKDFVSMQFAIGKAEVQVHAGRLRKKLNTDPGQAARLSPCTTDPCRDGARCCRISLLKSRPRGGSVRSLHQGSRV